MRITYFHNWATPALGCTLLSAGIDDVCLIAQPTMPCDRDPRLLELAEHHAAATITIEDITSEECARSVASFAPDLIIVSAFPEKLPNRLLTIARLAAVNVHWSLLPAYRGPAPDFWAIRNGEEQTGVTIHLMTERFDAGSIIAQQVIPLDSTESLSTVSTKLEDAGARLMMNLLERYRRGEVLTGREQDESLATRAPFVRAHHLEIRWRETALSIERLTRAAFPCLCPHTYFHGEELVLRETQCFNRSALDLSPGQLFYDPLERQLLAGTGHGLLSLKRLEFHGTTMDGPGFGLTLAPGERLG
jgi:methionyl-tRNA formyltransferase